MDLHDLPEEKRARAVARFLRCVKPGEIDACWEWTGHLGGGTNRGYGTFNVDYSKRKSPRACGAHRFAWEVANSRPIPKGLRVLHRCDNPPCVNPGHLRLGTQADNMRDMVSKGRDRKAHKLTDGQVRELRRKRAAGALLEQLAAEFGVRISTVSRIASGKARKRVRP